MENIVSTYFARSQEYLTDMWRRTRITRKKAHNRYPTGPVSLQRIHFQNISRLENCKRRKVLFTEERFPMLSSRAAGGTDVPPVALCRVDGRPDGQPPC